MNYINNSSTMTITIDASSLDPNLNKGKIKGTKKF